MTHKDPCRAPGRPRASESEAQRERHLACLAARTMLGLPTATIAKLLDVSVRTVQLWQQQALAYPEAQDRERLAAALVA